MSNIHKIVVRVAGKVNLSLEVTGRRGNLHTLKMIMSSINLYDEVCYCQNDNKDLHISAKSDLAGFDALRFVGAMQKVADKFASRFGKIGGDIVITKNIPLGAGLGGSTASIVGVLKALCFGHQLTGCEVELDTEFLLSLGSDVPYMFVGGFARVEGVGEIVCPILHKKLHFVVVCPKSSVDSKDAYQMFDNLNAAKETTNLASNKDEDAPFRRQDEAISTCNKDEAISTCNKDEFILTFKKAEANSTNINSICEAIERQQNDLEKGAMALNTDVAKAKLALKNAGAKSIVMSGSGSAVLAICRSAEEAREIAKKTKFDGSIAQYQSLTKTKAVYFSN